MILCSIVPSNCQNYAVSNSSFYNYLHTIFFSGECFLSPNKHSTKQDSIAAGLAVDPVVLFNANENFKKLKQMLYKVRKIDKIDFLVLNWILI